MADAPYDPYAWWRNATEKGERGPIHDGHPQPGFYRYRVRETKMWAGIGIWIDAGSGQTLATMGGKLVDANDAWSFGAKNPIKEAAFRHWESTGRFPEDGDARAPEIPASDRTVTIGDNSPPVATVFDRFKHDVEAEVEEAKAFLAKPIDTQEAADRAGVWAAKLTKLGNDADGERDVEQRPHLEKVREVNEKWRETIANAKAYGQKLKEHLGAWLKKKRDEETARQAKAQQEAQEAAAALQALKASADAADADQAAALTARVAETSKAAQPRAVSAGRTGAKVKLVTVQVLVVTDYAATLAHYKDRPEIRTVVEKLAAQDLKASVPVPGAMLDTQEKPR